MRTVLLVLALLGVSLAMPPALEGQATRTWVSGVGDDANPCSRTAPCKTFAGAISKTAASGEISVLDPGGFGAVTITKSISIIASDSGEGGVLAGGTNGIVINAGAADVVTLRGLIIEGAGTGLNGIRFLAGKALNVENCVIADFRASSAGNGHGISFRPSGASHLYVVDTVVENNGIGSTGGGILVQPTGAGSAAVVLNRVSMPGNVFGFKADGTGSTGGIKATLDDNVASSSTFSGVVAITPAGGAPVDLFVNRSVIANNGSNGIRSEGAGARVRLSDSTVTGNLTGLSIVGGSVISFSNNRIRGNVGDGVPNGSETEN